MTFSTSWKSWKFSTFSTLFVHQPFLEDLIHKHIHLVKKSEPEVWFVIHSPKILDGKRFCFFNNCSTLITQTLCININFFQAMQPALDYPLDVLMYLFILWNFWFPLQLQADQTIVKRFPDLPCSLGPPSKPMRSLAWTIFLLSLLLTMCWWKLGKFGPKNNYRSLWRVTTYESGWMDWWLSNVSTLYAFALVQVLFSTMALWLSFVLLHRSQTIEVSCENKGFGVELFRCLQMGNSASSSKRVWGIWLNA